MKLLLDHCVPKPFRRELIGHLVKTAFEMGWAELDNRKLLAKAAGNFDAFITVDQNMQYQRNLTAIPLPVLVLIAEDNDTETLKPYGVHVLRALAELKGPALFQIHGDGSIRIIASSSPEAP